MIINNISTEIISKKKLEEESAWESVGLFLDLQHYKQRISWEKLQNTKGIDIKIEQQVY